MSDEQLEDFDNAKLWHLPNVGEELETSAGTNALNRPKNQWKFEAPEEEVEIEPLTAEQIEQIRQDAHKEGFELGQQEGFEKAYKEGLISGEEKGIETGIEQGYEQGLAKAQTEIDALKEKLEGMITSLNKPLDYVQQELKQELLLLAVSLSKAVTKTECNTNQEVLLLALNDALAVLPINQNDYTIELHPEDASWFRSHFTEQTILENNWSIRENQNLSQGGCKVTTSNNAVDVSINKRTQQIYDRLLLEQGLFDDPRAQ